MQIACPTLHGSSTAHEEELVVVAVRLCLGSTSASWRRVALSLLGRADVAGTSRQKTAGCVCVFLEGTPKKCFALASL